MLMNEQQVHTLMEALPYLSNFKDKTIVVKYGGTSLTLPTKPISTRLTSPFS